MFDDYDDLLTVEEMRQLLGIGKNSAYDLLRKDIIKSFRIGRVWKVPKKSIEAYILKQSGGNGESNNPWFG